MSLVSVAVRPATATPRWSRFAYADNLKVALVAGVIVGHVTMAYMDEGGWTLSEPPVREPLLTVLKLLAVIGVMFAMALFFLVAGVFTPRSLERKRLRRFMADRTLRLLLPVVFFALLLSPFTEYVDTDNVGWDKGFPAFVLHMWTDPAPGPTWFLLVLLLFSAVYALTRTIVPRTVTAPRPMRWRMLAVAAMFIALASYGIRFAVPFGEEWWHLALGQAPAWVTGFTLGVVGAERGWFDHMSRRTSRRLFRIAWTLVVAVTITIGIAAALGGEDGPDVLFGGGTWQSLVMSLMEGPLVVAMSLWLFDVFRHRVDHQGPLMARLSRAAFAAFIIHQIVAVGAVLATRHVGLPPEIEWAGAATVAVVASFAVGALIVRLPGVRRIV